MPDAMRRKAAALGEAGAAWLAGLDGRVRDLAARWSLSVGRALPGGAGAFVAEVRTAAGRDAVLKVAPSALDPAAGELGALLAARGRGWVGVLRHDAARGAMLLERPGAQLREPGLPVDARIGATCATLARARTRPPEGSRFAAGAEKASSLAALAEGAWRGPGEPCSARAVDTAPRLAEARRRAFDRGTAVLAHGDAHARDALAAPGEGPARFRLADPDGLFVDRAHDLAAPVRE